MRAESHQNTAATKAETAIPISTTTFTREMNKALSDIVSDISWSHAILRALGFSELTPNGRKEVEAFARFVMTNAGGASVV